MIKKSIRVGAIAPYPTFEEQRYLRELLYLVKAVKALIMHNTLSSISFKTAYSSNLKQDHLTDYLEQTIEFIKLKSAYEVSKLVGDLIRQAARINLFNKNSFNNSRDGLKRTYNEFFEPKIIQDELRLWALDNARLIKSIPEQMIDKVASKIAEGVRARTSITALSRELEAVLNISKNRAKLIARDQTAKLNGRLTRHRNLLLGITQYKWLTSRDERVRHTHDVLESKICSWEDETIYKNPQSQTWKKRSTIKGAPVHPGLDIMCRCTSVSML